MNFMQWLVSGWTPLLIALAIALAARLVGGEWRRRRIIAQCRRRWGKADPDRLRDPDQLAPWHHFHANTLPDDLLIDERTANDLHLDELLATLDHTTSRLGQQALYHRLRTRLRPEERVVFEAQVERVMADPVVREAAQVALHPLDDPALWGVWRLSLPGVIPTHAVFVLAPLIPILLVVSVGLVAVTPLGLFGILVAMVLALTLRVSMAWRVTAVVASFRQLGRVFTAASALTRLPGEEFAPLTQRLHGHLRRLGRIKWAVRWLGRGTLDDPISLLLEYFNLIFLLDLNLLRWVARHLTDQGDDLRAMLGEIGEVDVVLAVGSWRVTRQDWCRPTFTAAGTRAVFEGLHHPLLADPVPQDLVMAPPAGLLITGSNMSGKSTLLRTLGVATVLAETIHTVPGRRYVGPTRTVRSCIGRVDDLMGGRSYYLTEVERVLALLTAAAGGTPHLLLFDELFRGTNTIERIAAGEAVLRALVQDGEEGTMPHLVVAATHDGELVELLAGVYEPWHYTESIGADGLQFDYRLRPGPATTRNAVALLARYGAPEALVARARARVALLEQRPTVAVTNG